MVQAVQILSIINVFLAVPIRLWDPKPTSKRVAMISLRIEDELMDAVVFELNRNRLASIIADSWRIDYQYVQSADSNEDLQPEYTTA